MRHRLASAVRAIAVLLSLVACHNSGSQAGNPTPVSAAGIGACPQNDDVQLNKKGLPNEEKLTNHIRTLPFEQILKEEATDEYGLYLSSRVISPISPVVVRQDNPTGPKYQEGLGYTFLINSVKFPGLTRMDDGRLVLILSGALKPSSTTLEGSRKRDGLLLLSEDEGKSWTQPRRFPLHRATPVNLGGKKLLAYGSHPQGGLSFVFSDNAGQSWSDLEPIRLKLPDGRDVGLSDLSYHPLVEGNTLTFIGNVNEKGEPNWDDKGAFAWSSVLLRYHPDTHTWEPPSLFSIPTGAEGVVTRAENGDLVAAFRTQLIGVPVYSDHWMGLSTSTSPDNGKTWSEPTYHNLYGHHHMHLLTLPDKRILMTYAARIGELDGMTYHGVEAVLSHDNGASWDWAHRYILFRWTDQITHSPQSVLLSDGRILTIFLHGTSYSWTDGDLPATKNGVNLVHLGNVSVVVWKLESKHQR